jgi:hypothetical protein
MPAIKGIISFPSIFTPKLAKGATDPKYSCALLLQPNDPQVAVIQAEVNRAKADTFPNGYNGADECFQPYDTKYAGKEYYDARFSGWWVLSGSSRADDKPAIVDAGHQPIIDPGAVRSGDVVYAHINIGGYTKGRGGIGGFLNGVMLTGEEPPMGYLDGKPSVESMFANIGAAPAPAAPAAPAPAAPAAPAPAAPAPVAPAAPAPVAPPVPPAPNAPVPLQMTAAANGVTLEQYLATPGWTEELLIEQGLAIRHSFM